MKLSINQLKYLKSLHERKYRQKYHNFIVEGTKLAEEVLVANTLEVELLVATPTWLSEHPDSISRTENLVEVEEGELKKISLLSTPNQVFLVVKQPKKHIANINIAQGISLYLDDIRDPGNMGTILRIADWFGIQYVFCSPDCVEVYNPKVVQASMGAFLRVNFQETSIKTLNATCPDVPIYGTLLEGNSIYNERPVLPAIIAIGNESKGLSDEVQTLLTHKISIPKGIGGGAESLNAAVATGIICAFFAARNQTN